jgi:hypothetical protein
VTDLPHPFEPPPDPDQTRHFVRWHAATHAELARKAASVSG